MNEELKEEINGCGQTTTSTEEREDIITNKKSIIMKKILKVLLCVSAVSLIVYQAFVIKDLKDDMEDYQNYFDTVENTFRIMEESPNDTYQDFVESYEYCDYYHYKRVILEKE